LQLFQPGQHAREEAPINFRLPSWIIKELHLRPCADRMDIRLSQVTLNNIRYSASQSVSTTIPFFIGQQPEATYPNIIRQITTDMMMPTVSATKPAGTAWRVLLMLTDPK
jgi:hypothetical protein